MSRHKLSSQSKPLVAGNPPADPPSGRALGAHTEEIQVPPKVLQRIVAGDYAGACQMLQAAPYSRELQHVLGVCLLRAGQDTAAVNLFRGICLMPGTTVIRRDVDDRLKVNYATAMLMHGHPAGAESILDEVRDPNLPAALELRSAIKRWAAGLSFWRKWDWKLSRVEPPDAKVPLDHEPGILPVALGPPPPLDSSLSSPLPPQTPPQTPPHLAA